MSKRKRIDEVMKLSKEELYNYLREEDNSLTKSDRIDMKPFERGLKIFYYHANSDKPYKTRVYLNHESDSLR